MERIREYFRLEDDFNVTGRWHLNGLYDSSSIELDPRDFTCGASIELEPVLRVSLPDEYRSVVVNQPLRVALSRPGHPLDFTFGAFDIPVARTFVGEIFNDLAHAEIQRIPVCIDGSLHSYEIINVSNRIDCIDATRSEIQWWKPGNDIRPDLAGKPEMITKLVIDPSRVGDRHIFRLEGWTIAIIVSDVIKNAFEDKMVSGVTFKQV